MINLESYWLEDKQIISSTFDPQERHTTGYGLAASVINDYAINAAMAFTQNQEISHGSNAPRTKLVTGWLKIKHFKPTPWHETLKVKAWIEEVIGNKLKVICELGTGEEITAVGEATILRVQYDKILGVS